MTQRVVFAVAAAVVLNAVLSANSAQAARPTLDVADKGDDVRVLPFNSPYTTITRAERLSIDVKRLTVTPRADGTVHFAVEVGEILRSKRFFQQIDVVFRRKTTSRPGWAVAGVGWTPGGWKPGAPQAYAYMDLAPLGSPDFDQRRCKLQDIRAVAHTTTLSANVPNRCVPTGDAKVWVFAKTRYRKVFDSDTASTDDFSRDVLKVPLAVVRPAEPPIR